ncbi:MAG: recombination regulator RecX [Christensenellaceae bacterium]|jgi:regulatory protein|nr:recombination regulator RecX [Christensenellaceae bacterium]
MQINKLKIGARIAEISIDNHVYKVSPAILKKREYKVNDTLTEEELEDFLNESDRDNAWEYLVGMLARSLRCEKDVRDTLREKGYRYTSVRYVIAKALEMGILDDRKYAEFFILSSQESKGIELIKKELSQKEIDEDIIDELIEKADINESLVCIDVMTQYMKGKNYSDPRVVERLIKFLIARGFSIKNIKNATPLIGNYFKEHETITEDLSNDVTIE